MSPGRPSPNAGAPFPLGDVELSLSSHGGGECKERPPLSLHDCCDDKKVSISPSFSSMNRHRSRYERLDMRPNRFPAFVHRRERLTYNPCPQWEVGTCLVPSSASSVDIYL